MLITGKTSSGTKFMVPGQAGKNTHDSMNNEHERC